MTLEDLYRDAAPSTQAEAAALATLLTLEAANQTLRAHGMSDDSARTLCEQAGSAAFAGHRTSYPDEGHTSWAWAVQVIHRAVEAEEAPATESMTLAFDEAKPEEPIEIMPDKPRVRVPAIYAPSDAR